jgi:hypothetical protein
VSNIPGVSEACGLVEQLRTQAQDFATREAALLKDHRARVTAETRLFDTTTRDQNERTAAALREAEAAMQRTREAAQARFERRKKRIGEAHKNARNQVAEFAERYEGRRKHEIQRKGLEAERRRDTGLAQTQASLQEFRGRLDAIHEVFQGLERGTHRALGGYGSLRKLLAHDRTWPEPDLAADEGRLLQQLEQQAETVRDALRKFERQAVPAVFRYFPLWLWIVLLALGCAGAVPALRHGGVSGFDYPRAGVVFGVFMVVVVTGWALAGRKAMPAAMELARSLGQARRRHQVANEKADQRYVAEQDRVRREFDEGTRTLDRQWQDLTKEGVALRNDRRQAVDEQGMRLAQRHQERHAQLLERLEREHTAQTGILQAKATGDSLRLKEAHAGRMAKINADFESQWQALEKECRAGIEPLYNRLREAKTAADALFPAWDAPAWNQWAPPDAFQNAARFGELEIQVDRLTEAQPAEKRLVLPCPPTFTVPLVLRYPQAGSLLFEAGKTPDDEALRAMNNLIFRLLACNPPGKLSFTIFDPVGLGLNFAGLMHLADYEESHINSRIWTQGAQIEEKLAELNEHMEKVIQMYLRNEYPTIAEYNAQAGAVAEKYHFLVVASFPVNFSDTAARRLINIASSGARCGVYTLIHWDQRHALPQDFVPDELRKNSVRLVRGEKGYELAGPRLPGTRLRLDAPPSPEFATLFLHEIGRTSKDTNRVEVPFQQVTPPDAQTWSEETTEELRVPIGRTGATKHQYLEIGKGTRQHALIAGKTGSGKSTLFHVIITNLALWCSPEQVEFYLVDFKKGVEFKCYGTRRLPHARVVAIESDREFGLSVLQRVDAELRRRGDLFRALGVQDVPGYKRAGGTEPMPRSLLMIDEFQEFFVEEDKVSQSAAVLLDRIVRQGRAFGIHVILGSQTLGGAYTLARATIGQMVVRIALQCNEADAYLIMDQDNPAPRLLSRPGEGIYNDSAGAIEGNSPFQAVWLSEDIRDGFLEKVRRRADAAGSQYPGPFVFEGNAPADVRDNHALNAALHTRPTAAPRESRIWLGAPNSIKGPTETVFQRQSGNHVLIVGQNDEAALSMIAVGLVSLAAQYPPGAVRLLLLDSIPPGSPQRAFLDRVLASIPHPVTQIKNSDLDGIMGSLDMDLKSRADTEQGTSAPDTFLFIQGVQNFKKLRQEDEFSFSSSSESAGPNPAAALQHLISDGPSHGVHIVASFDTYNNVGRFLGRKTLSEFEMRVLFQMSAADSASLIDSPAAGTLGLHRAVLYNDREASLETFRPYALPGGDWIERVKGDS